MSSGTATKHVSQATAEIGNIMATGGQVMLMIYALLLIIGLLLLFLFMKEWLNQRKDVLSAAALREAAQAIQSLNIQVSRLESTNGQLLTLLLQERGHEA